MFVGISRNKGEIMFELCGETVLVDIRISVVAV